jgi:hypothetical protein
MTYTNTVDTAGVDTATTQTANATVNVFCQLANEVRVTGGGAVTGSNNAGLLASGPTGPNMGTTAGWQVMNNNVKATVTAFIVCAH